MKKTRIFIGLLSVLFSAFFLFLYVNSYIFQKKFPDFCWSFIVVLNTVLSNWIILFLLLLGGMLVLFNKSISQFLYSLFGVSIFVESITQVIVNNHIFILVDSFLIYPLFFGIFSLVLVTSAKWKNRLGWDKKISLKLWEVFLIISFLISGLPRFFFDYPSWD